MRHDQGGAKLTYVAGIGDAVFKAFKTDTKGLDEGPAKLLKGVAGDMKDIGDAMKEDYDGAKLEFTTGASVTFKARLNLAIPVTPHLRHPGLLHTLPHPSVCLPLARSWSLAAFRL